MEMWWLINCCLLASDSPHSVCRTEALDQLNSELSLEPDILFSVSSIPYLQLGILCVAGMDVAVHAVTDTLETISNEYRKFADV